VISATLDCRDDTRGIQSLNANGQSLAYFYARENDHDANTAGVTPRWGRRNLQQIRRNVAMAQSSTVKNLGAVFDAHVKAEFIDKDVAATMATMVAEPYLTHVPTLTGGTGRLEVESFYRDHFVGHWPDDVEVKPLSRTVGHNRVVDELIVSFTHDREMRVFLPGVPPTGRKVVLPHVVVMGFDEAGRVAYEHIYWDQASLLVQVGLLDPALLPVSGAEQAKRLLDNTQPANEMIERLRLKAKQR
jgi:carboxymethylenebutenolidase